MFNVDKIINKNKEHIVKLHKKYFIIKLYNSFGLSICKTEPFTLDSERKVLTNIIELIKENPSNYSADIEYYIKHNEKITININGSFMETKEMAINKLKELEVHKDEPRIIDSDIDPLLFNMLPNLNIQYNNRIIVIGSNDGKTLEILNMLSTTVEISKTIKDTERNIIKLLEYVGISKKFFTNKEIERLNQFLDAI